VENKEILHTVEKETNVLHTIKCRKANCIGHVLRRQCLLKHIIERKIERTERRGRRRNQLLEDFKEKSTILEFERGRTRSHFLENSLWERLWTFRKTDYTMNKLVLE
jgi:hypothetical protein